MKFMRHLLFSVSIFLVLPVSAGLPVYDYGGKELPTLAPLLKEINPSVVNIATFTTRPVAQNPLLNDPYFRRFFNVPPGKKIPQQRQRRTQSAGSGVIIDAEKGIVITNSHVVAEADEIVVGLDDGRTYQAKLLGADPEVDIAVLELQDFEDLTALKLSDSEKLQQGDFVLAIGNPFGLGHSVTSGLVSALGRSGLGIEGYENFIQTDASINPGNSGGALVNLRGELVGINTAIFGSRGGSVGIGFAIPINMAKSSIDQILEHGEVKRGQLGVIIQDLSPELAKAFELDKQQKGVVVAQVQEGSAADKAGVQAGDVVVAVNKKTVETASQLRNEIGLRQIGDKIKLAVLRDGKSKTIRVTIGEALSAISGSVGTSKFLTGVSLQNNDGGGVVITGIEEDAAVTQSGLRKGDVILSANRQTVHTVEDLRRAAKSSSDRLVLRIRRGNAALYLVLQ